SLSVASAVAELDLTGAPVIVFQHAGSGRVNVVYRRRDGAIGWLDPQAPREPSRAG
ncbi:MAG TPA: sigma 54 modulation/S30EA ribosomal C-terminal domain-containing protein, partial [Roseiarcus sp.]|nr:sigma 54 modulation/S30EA ribosomal C-terminal domain-containing protein [Roseiarcus sp.]